MRAGGPDVFMSMQSTPPPPPPRPEIFATVLQNVTLDDNLLSR